jgi:hypothetical protein
MIRPLAIVFLYVILFALSRGILFSINSECHHVSGTTIYKCTSLKSGKYTMQCDSDVSRVMFLRFYEAVEIDIYRKLTPRLHNIKVQLGEPSDQLRYARQCRSWCRIVSGTFSFELFVGNTCTVYVWKGDFVPDSGQVQGPCLPSHSCIFVRQVWN